MPRRYLSFSPGEFYHFYNRGVNRGAIFFEEDNYLLFLYNLERYLAPVMDVVAFCLMPTHYHILGGVRGDISSSAEVTGKVSKAMMRLSVSYTKAVNHRYDRVGPLFQGAFQAKHIDSNAYLWQLSGYIHLNPVEAGLVKSPEDWEYSSCRAYLGLDLPSFLPHLDLRGLKDLGGLYG
jgi:REP element-mobilizing transposase RayT